MRAVDPTTAAAAGIVRPEIRALQAYRLPYPQAPRAAEAARLHQNEAPEDWPEAVKREVLERLMAMPWHRYPSARAEAVCEAIGKLQETPASMIAATSGSNEALWAAYGAFAAGGTVVMPLPTYSMARPLAIAAGARVIDVPLGAGFALDPDAVLRAAHARRAELIYLASPNNPTGNAFAADALIRVIEGAPGAVLIDEAYWEFTSTSFVDALRRYPHLVLSRTFSKAMGGAGLRVGWLTAPPALIAELDKVIPPYSLNVLAQAAAPVLVAHRQVATSQMQTIVVERRRVARALEALDMRVHPSETNFLLFEPRRPPADVWRALAERGVLIRNVSGAPRLGTCLRVSIGAPSDNDRFLAALRHIIGGTNGGSAR